MIVKDLFAMCDKDKLMACIAEKYRDALHGVPEAVAVRYLPVLEELATITPVSDRMHFVLGVRGDRGVEAMDFYQNARENLGIQFRGVCHKTVSDIFFRLRQLTRFSR